MRSRALRLMPVAVLAGAFTLTGCGGGDEAGDKPTGAKEAWLEGNKLDAELDQTVERLTRQCMEAKGFTVHPYGGIDGEMWVFNPEEIISSEAMGPKLTLESARKEGYGFDPRIERGEDDPVEGASGAPDPGGSASAEPGGDPDAFYGLPEEEQERYFIALEGVDRNKIMQEQADGGASTEVSRPGEVFDEPDFPTFEKIVLPDGSKRQYPTQGCSAEVNAKVFSGGMADYLETEFYALDKFGSVVWKDVAETAEMQALNTAWSDCMNGRGFDGLAAPEDAYERASGYYWGEMVSDGSDGATVYEEPEPKSDAELDEAREKEIKLAVAHAECATETSYEDGHSRLLKGALDTYLVDQETRLFHWYEYVKASLVTAQNLLKGQ